MRNLEEQLTPVTKCYNFGFLKPCNILERQAMKKTDTSKTSYEKD